MDSVTIVNHPLVQHKLSLIRQKDTSCHKFRNLLREISGLIAYEVTRDLPLHDRPIETPVATTTGRFIEGSSIVLISILRAGNGLLEGMLDLLPTARVGHIGLYRDPNTLIPVEYYFKLPEGIDKRDVILVDPMLATGHSAAAATTRIKQANPRSIKFVCLLAAPEGVEYYRAAHPEVPIYTASVDERLNEHSYIVPGLGDAGDRIYNT